MSKLNRPYYINKKGGKVELSITFHAINRFAKRWNRLHPEQLMPGNVDEEITKLFSYSNRLKNLSQKEKNRLRRYGNDTLFFRHNDFTFIVQNMAIVTVEVSSKGKRHMN